ncbi:MAG TPA: hypothetical protein VNO21_08160, partial [Polyangiaceae bacterium]|nr:hypothetical protein [Polyangiaceae bacterium]
ALAALGFALHGAHGHRALAERDGGRPMYEPDLVREANADQGLLFFDTDHGFNLAYDPTLTASHGILAVRRRNDDGDRILYDLLGHPGSHVYKFAPVGNGRSIVETWNPVGVATDTYRFEAEVEWPPFAQGGGYAEPIFASDAGASADRVLELTPTDPHEAWVEIELPLPRRDAPLTVDIEPRVLLCGTGGKASLSLYDFDDVSHRSLQPAQAHSTSEPWAHWDWSDDLVTGEKPKHMRDLPARTVTFSRAPIPVSLRMVLTAERGAVGLDKTTVKAHR